MLAEKISGTHIGLWFLVPEHLRLGSWDLLKTWAGCPNDNATESRLALQMVHESALCANGIRQQRTLRHKGFEVLNGLPFVATDKTIHCLLDSYTMADAEALQLALAKLRQTQGHYKGNYVLIDPRRIHTWSRRDMQPKKPHRRAAVSRKVAQTFFATDGETGQPYGFGMGSSAVTINQATLPLLQRIAPLLPPQSGALGLLDAEHCTADILNWFSANPLLACLMPAPRYQKLLKLCATLSFTRLWPGYATAESVYQLRNQDEPMRTVVQRTGEREQDFDYKPFVTTSALEPEKLMTLIYPERLNIEEFFRNEGALGWNRAGTFNLNIRFGRLSMALIAQAVIYQFRQKLPVGIRNWTVESIAEKFFKGIDGDIRVKDDRIIVTCYNAPEVEIFKEQYERSSEKLAAEGIDPRVPWLYDLKVDFRFK
jgi:hypothetical protein